MNAQGGSLRLLIRCSHLHPFDFLLSPPPSLVPSNPTCCSSALPGHSTSSHKLAIFQINVDSTHESGQLPGET